MRSGALIKIPDDFDIQRLNALNWSRLVGGQTIQSVIQFTERTLATNIPTGVQAALAIHQDIIVEPTLIREQDGRYSIVSNDVVKTSWSNIYATQGVIVVDTLDNRKFVRQIINNGLYRGARLGIVSHDVHLDTARIIANHPDQWIRGFADRMGRVDHGTVFGEAVERDTVFGPELNRSAKKSIGWVTRFFGPPTKIKVSPSGSITIWANPTIDVFLRFVRTEILPYMIALP
jgi:hypothetical protein